TTPNGHTIDSDRNHRYPSSSNIYHSAKGGGRIQVLAARMASRYPAALHFFGCDCDGSPDF
ncbi:hypothetical protein, partial [Candidatus Igneacidithiobacillus taiwanensis]|uniref:hypothetical protein n=1 Tax=Candidatus Igneacidithiobacillus taiwanensis TaxID=1945924 RepID=UPI00289AF66B